MSQESSSQAGTIAREMGLPGMMTQAHDDNTDLYRGYVVRYYKGNLDDLEQLSFLEDIQTKALSPSTTGIVLVETKTTFFQDQCIVVLKYLEKRAS